MNEVTWKITDVDEVLGNITVNFTDGVRENSNVFNWSGDKDQLISMLNEVAITFKQSWAEIPPMLVVTKHELLQLTGSSAN